MDCPCKLRILKSDGRFIIYGPASVEVVDRQRDKIRAEGLDVALPQLLQAARFSRNHEDVLVGAILPEYQADDGTLYKTGVVDNKLMVVGEVWDNTKAARDTRQGILDKTLRSFSISGEILPNGSKNVCDRAGCYRDIFKLDLHAVTICERGMNQEAHFNVIQKGERDGIEYITIATPDFTHMKISKAVENWILMSDDEVAKADYPWEQCVSDMKAQGHSEESAKRICAAIKNRTVAHKMAAEKLSLETALDAVVKKTLTDSDFSYILDKLVKSHVHASEKETEVIKTMAENTTPPQEAKKAEPGAAPTEGAGNGGVEAKLDQLCAMCQQMMQMMGGGGQVQAAQKAAEPAAPAQTQKSEPVNKELEDLKKQVAAQAELINKLKTASVAQTPRPDGLNKSELERTEALSPEKLRKMSIREIEMAFPRGAK